MISTALFWTTRLFFPVILLIWLSQPALALTFSEETATCPLDGKTFPYRAVASYSQFGMQLDLRPTGALLAPIPMPVCPNSGFVIYRDDFEDGEISAARRLVRTPEYVAMRETETDYFVAAYQASVLGEDAWTVAILTVQATWEAQDDPEKYRRYAALTMTRLKEAGKDYSPIGETGEKWWTTNLLLVNFHRRLAEFERAAKLLAELPYQKEAEDSGYRIVGERLADLIAAKDSAPAEVAPR